MNSEWAWEVVTTRPSGHLRYHARLRMPNDQILLITRGYEVEEHAYQAIRLIAERAPITPITPVSEI
jgi:uncharacterized protein YegP (UPF0339 family)